MTSARYVLSDAEADGLELMLAGMLRPASGYRAPGMHPPDWSITPTLRVPSILLDRGAPLEFVLTDRENTGIAVIRDPEFVSADEEQVWLVGEPVRLRPSGGGVARWSRLATGDDLTASTVAVFTGKVRPADVLRAVHESDGGPVMLVAELSGSRLAEDAALVDDLLAAAEQIPGSVVRSLLVPDYAGGTSASETAVALLRGRGARRIVRFGSGEPASPNGGVVLFTGLSGSGKSTVAKALIDVLTGELRQRAILLDGDEVRQELSAGLGFSREDREVNLRRIAWVAARIAEVGALAVCAPIAPFARTRDMMRDLISPYGQLVLVYVSTPLEVAEARDRKGLYAQARQGLISDFTGIDSPYEIPEEPDLSIDTAKLTVDESVAAVLELLERRGLCSRASAPSNDDRAE